MDIVREAVSVFAEIWVDPETLANNLGRLNGFIKKMSLSQESNYYDRISHVMETNHEHD